MSNGTTPGQATPVQTTPPPRRKSIFGALIWITIGGLLLANNLGANIRIGELFWKYWPVFLILLGVVKILEHFAAQQSGQTPARILNGGEVVLLIFLFLILGSYAGFNRAVESGEIDISDVPWWTSYSFTEETSIPAKPNLPINITTTRGGITVHPEDISQIRVVLTKSIHGNDQADAETRAKGYSVEIVESAGGYDVRAKAPGGRTRNASLSLEVHVPRKAPLTLRTDNGEIRVQNGLTGDLTIRSGNGDVEVRDVTGKVRIEGVDNVTVAGVQGDVEVTGRVDDVDISDVTGQASVRGDIYGSARLKNIGKQAVLETSITRLTLGSLKGRLDLASGELEVVDAPGSLELTTRNKDIRLENVAGRIQIDNRRSGDVEIRLAQPPQQPITIENEKGTVEVTMPSASMFEIQATSQKGDAESEFKDGLNIREEDNVGKIDGKVGTRGPQIQIRTTYGTVRLRKAG